MEDLSCENMSRTFTSSVFSHVLTSLLSPKPIMEDLFCESLSRLLTSPDLVSHLQALRLDGGEKNVSFQWLGPHFLTFLKYAKKSFFLIVPIEGLHTNGHAIIRHANNPYAVRRSTMLRLLEPLDDSAYHCLEYGDTEHYKKFLEIILTVMPELNEFFTIQGHTVCNMVYWEFFIDFLFESIQELLGCHNDSTVLVSNQVQFLQKELNFLLTFLVYPIPSNEEEQKSIITEIEALFTEAGLFLHSFFFTTDLVTSTKMDLAIFDLLERIEIVLVKIKDYSIAVSSGVGIESLQVAESPIEVGIGSLQAAESPSEVSSSQDNSSPMVEKIIVGLKGKTTKIVDKLLRGPMYRQTISIVGMGGLGKTTLARKTYDHSHVRQHFDERCWCTVSQTYNKRKLLIDILSSISNFERDEILKMEDEDLAERLHKSLKRRRYLIIMDDLWDKEAWEDLIRLFPDDKNGSRVLFTSRLKNVASEISQVIIKPRPLSPGESWNLLELKVFKKERCPRELQDIGKQIAANCKGLPLRVVLIAGILSNMEKKESSWQEVANSLSDYISKKADDYIPTLKLSYIHLPDHLKPCFLYLSAFHEDEQIPVRKLLLLWIAEGLIEEREQKTLEDVAEEYLMELIDRSLLQVVERRSDNGVKTCNLHDLVLDMCSKMVEEDDEFLFQHQFLVSKHRRLRRLYMGQFRHVWMSKNISEAFSIFYNLEKIRILDSSNGTNVLPGIKLMPDLRYLEISRLVPSIGKLHNLEYLSLPFYKMKVPTYLLNMPKLRHLRLNGEDNGASFNKNSDSFRINCLQTLGWVSIFDTEDEKILRCSPNLRTLKCGVVNYFPDLNFLSQLQSLRITMYGILGDFSMVKFPMNIKMLTLRLIGLPWEKMSLIGTLPNLEILKLGYNSFAGEIWETKDGEFQKLKFLKLELRYLEQWNSSNDHFPVLERLVLERCIRLKEIPFEFSYIVTLKEIKVLYCGENVGTSAQKILEEQKDYGNTELDVTTCSYPSLNIY